MKSAVLIAVLGTIGLVLVLWHTATPASAVCSPSRNPPDLRETANTVFLGEVVREEAIEGRRGYESTLSVAVTLKGSPGSKVVIYPLGSANADCSGGPRLELGQRALVYLHTNDPWTTNTRAQSVFRSSQFTPIYGLLGWEGAEDAVLKAADITGAREERVEAALAFSEGGPFPEGMAGFENPNGSWRDPLVGVLVALGAALLVRLGLSTRKRPSP